MRVLKNPEKKHLNSKFKVFTIYIGLEFVAFS